MGRWHERRERRHRAWMVPGGEANASDGDNAAPHPGVDTTRVYRTPWARGPRAPLRRCQGVPDPVETPLYLHRTELARVRLRRRRALAVVGVIVAATLVMVLLRGLAGY
ncbi:MAG: hypothetical protein RQ751_09455 [Longimicrobiales bacterium]|nr:hypothetical protein [Longimicrobiales bacterium]